MAMSDAFEGRIGFGIKIEETSDTGPYPNTNIAFPSEFANPAIGIDSGNRFVEHEIIGGSTVRQRIGTEPSEVDISGVCNESIAKELERLRNVEIATIFSSRFPLESISVHIVSVSTQPFEDGGSVKLDGDEFLYSYDLNCVEVPSPGE